MGEGGYDLHRTPDGLGVHVLEEVVDDLLYAGEDRPVLALALLEPLDTFAFV